MCYVRTESAAVTKGGQGLANSQLKTLKVVVILYTHNTPCNKR